MYEIQCDTVENLTVVCVGLLKEGICFKADTTTLKIILTGGY